MYIFAASSEFKVLLNASQNGPAGTDPLSEGFSRGKHVSLPLKKEYQP